MASPNELHTPSGQEESSRDHSGESSNTVSRGGSRPPREKHRVRFNPGGESLDSANQKSAFDLQEETGAPVKGLPLRPSPNLQPASHHGRHFSTPALRLPSPHNEGGTAESSRRPPASRPAPSIMRLPSSRSSESDEEDMPLEMAPAKRISTGPGKKQQGEKERDQDSDDEENVANENADDDDGDDNDEDNTVGKAFSEKTALERAARLSRTVGTQSAPATRHPSPVRRSIARSPPPSPPPETRKNMPIDLNDIPLEKLNSKRTKYGIEDESEDDELDEKDSEKKKKKKKRRDQRILKSARRVARQSSNWRSKLLKPREDITPPLHSGQVTPVEERDPFAYVPKPKHYREGYISSLLKLYDQQGAGSALAHIPRSRHAIDSAVDLRNSANASLLGSSFTTPAGTPQGSPNSPESTQTPTPVGSPPPSGTATPKIRHEKWYYKNQQHRSTGSIADLVGSSTILAQPGIQGSKEQSSAMRPKPKHKPRSSQAIDAVLGKQRKARSEDEIRIKIHIAETMQRQRYILKMCRALMAYGAPTHRLEEYMRMSARVLELEAQFLYMPGCMIISFDDPGSHTTEVKLVRSSQAVNLGKLREAHEIYKEVVHDTIGVEEAMVRLNTIISAPNYYSPWFLVFVYGLASACVGPFAFGARPIDLPIAFLLGCLLGFMALIIAPRSDLYNNIFEISAAVLTSFLARAFGSLHHGSLFCFSALAQSSIALILPGYTVLCGSLELQSRSILAGSVRMVYAIIYSLFLGFGITIGSSLYGWADSNATSATTCPTAWPFWWEVIFVPPFTLCLIIINQGKAKQMPVMLAIALVGYIVNHFSALRFASNAQIANTLGALAIGVLGNLYSRLRHGMAAAALLPAIFVQVPSGLAASGSLISGVVSANQITNRTGIVNGTSQVGNGTQVQMGNGAAGSGVNSAVLNVGFDMIQVAIGITVGLFLSALVVYPFGKKRSGLFSF